MIDNAAGHSHRCHIAVTGVALNGSGNMRGMIESHVSFISPSVDALPRNIFAALEISGGFLHRRIVRGDCPVTGHAPSNIWNDGPRAGKRAIMAIETFHLRFFNVSAMDVRHGLDGFRSQAKEMPGRNANGRVRRSENTGRPDRGILRNILSPKNAVLKKQPRNDPTSPQDDEQCDQSATRSFTVSFFLHTAANI